MDDLPGHKPCLLSHSVLEHYFKKGGIIRSYIQLKPEKMFTHILIPHPTNPDLLCIIKCLDADPQNLVTIEVEEYPFTKSSVPELAFSWINDFPGWGNGSPVVVTVEGSKKQHRMFYAYSALLNWALGRADLAIAQHKTIDLIDPAIAKNASEYIHWYTFEHAFVRIEQALEGLSILAV